MVSVKGLKAFPPEMGAFRYQVYETLLKLKALPRKIPAHGRYDLVTRSQKPSPEKSGCVSYEDAPSSLILNTLPQRRACSRQLDLRTSRARADGMGRWVRAEDLARAMSVGGVRDK